jgi:hypothetical protein
MARIAPIKMDADHAAALARIDALMDAEAGRRRPMSWQFWRNLSRL